MRLLSERIVAAKAKKQEAAAKFVVAENRVRVNGPLALLNWEGDPGPNQYLAQGRAIGEMVQNGRHDGGVSGTV